MDITKKQYNRICVVLVVDDLGYGGAERQVIELANNLDRSFFDVHVCSLSEHLPLGDQLNILKNNLHVVARKFRFDFTVVPRLARLLKKLKADIVHGYLFSAEIASRLAGSIAGTCIVIGSERNANRVQMKKSDILTYKMTQRFIDIIIANSNAGAESHRNIFNFPASNYRIVHNGVDVERFKPLDGTLMRDEFAIPNKCLVIGCFANFKKQKNHAMLFRAFRLVLDSLPDTRLLLIGERPADSRGKLDNYKNRLDHLINDLGIRNRCIFLGHQSNTEKIYPICNVTALSSFHEGIPNVLLESMACGVPAVATDVCDNKYIINNGENGFLIDIDDERTMAERMKMLLIDILLRQEMGIKARKWMIKEFSTKRLAEKIEAIYMELLNKKQIISVNCVSPEISA